MTDAVDRAILRTASGVVLDLVDAAVDLGPPPGMDAALEALAEIEAGAPANLDEGRMVGHYWLRDARRAPTVGIATDIQQAIDRILALDADPHIASVLVVGIGGSALGTQLAWDCLAPMAPTVGLYFLDNTDPDGHARVLAALDPDRTLVLVVSKSGGTVETRNGLLAVEAWMRSHGVALPPRAIAITGDGSRLYGVAEEQGWRDCFPMWDWVGGRTSVTGPVGLVPMRLAGLDVEGLLEGAAAMDAAGRRPFADNPAARLAAAWFHAGQGTGERNLVIEPYKDRLALLGRYLQQLIMESLGKAVDRQGRAVHQGLTVYGNKGSTDQHAFVQQLRDGRDDALVHFVTVRAVGAQVPGAEGADGAPAHDHLYGFYEGTRAALREAGRPSLTITVPDTQASSLGALIALFERAVGIYAELIDINAYHQPGVEAGKLAAADVLTVLGTLSGALGAAPTTAAALAADCGVEPTLAWRALHHLAATGRAQLAPGATPSLDRFALAPPSAPSPWNDE